MWPSLHETTGLVPFPEEFHEGKLHFLCSEYGISLMAIYLFKFSIKNNRAMFKDIFEILHFEFDHIFYYFLQVFNGWVIPFSLNTGCIAQKIKFSIKDFFSKCDQIHTTDLVTFTDETLGQNVFPCVQRIIISF